MKGQNLEHTNVYVRKTTDAHPYELQQRAKQRLQERLVLRLLVERADAKAREIYNMQQRGKVVLQEGLNYGYCN